ncbi:Archease protein [Encephalitozoon hellem]|nr:Archease protein [Encephalitozoon hellem]
MQSINYKAVKGPGIKETGSIEFLDHLADVQMHCTASNLPLLYETAVRGMMSYAVKAPEAGETAGRVQISEGSCEMNMVALLTYFIDLMYGEGLVVVKTSVTLENGHLTCDYFAADGSRCQGLCEIKAVTLCGLRVLEKDGVFHSYCIFDI